MTAWATITQELVSATALHLGDLINVYIMRQPEEPCGAKSYVMR